MIRWPWDICLYFYEFRSIKYNQKDLEQSNITPGGIRAITL